MLSLLCKALLDHSSGSAECCCRVICQTANIDRKGWFNSVCRPAALIHHSWSSCLSPFWSKPLTLAVHLSPTVYGLARKGDAEVLACIVWAPALNCAVHRALRFALITLSRFLPACQVPPLIRMVQACLHRGLPEADAHWKIQAAR